jgi:hypothetical protein
LIRSRATTRTTLPAICVVAAVTAAAIVLTAGGWGSSPNEMPTSSFFDGTPHYKQHNALRSVVVFAKPARGQTIYPACLAKSLIPRNYRNTTGPYACNYAINVCSKK